MKSSHVLPKIRVEIRVLKGTEELIPESLYLLSPSGVWIEEKGEAVLLRFYPDDKDAFLKAMENSEVSAQDINIEEEAPKDYGELTKRYFRPIRIEDLTVLPPWSRRRPSGPSIVIEPGMAFGTGRHESTRLMIRIMKSMDMTGKTVIDLGCGSAILCLYARLLGAKRVVGVDIDPDTVANARKNTVFNNADNIDLVCTDLADVTGRYDVVLANIDIRTFTALSKKIIGFAKPGGLIVVSGIIGRDRKRLLSLFEPHALIRMEQKNSWRGFLFHING